MAMQLGRLRPILDFQQTPLPWRRAISAGLGIFVPMVLGILIGHPLWGMIATTGGFAAVYATDAAPGRLAVKLLFVVFGLAISVVLGTLSAGSPWLIAVISAVVAASATYICGALEVLPPGPFFFIMASAVSSAMPVDPSAAVLRGGLSLTGGIIAFVIGMAGRLWSWQTATGPANESTSLEDGMWTAAVRRFRAAMRRDAIVLPLAVRIGIGIFTATMVSDLLGNQKPYWVVIACSAVLIGKHMMATVHRAIQRAIGTSIGIFIAGAVFSLHPSFFVLAVTSLILQTIVELLVGRNYAVAVVFITPLGLIITESANVGLAPLQLIHARVSDNLLGIGIGLAAALLLWRRSGSNRLRLAVAHAIRSENLLLQAVLSQGPSLDGDFQTSMREMTDAVAHMEYIYHTAQHEFPRQAPVVDELGPTIAAAKSLAAALRTTVEDQDHLRALRDVRDSLKDFLEGIAESVEQNRPWTGQAQLPHLDSVSPLGSALHGLQTTAVPAQQGSGRFQTRGSQCSPPR